MDRGGSPDSEGDTGQIDIEAGIAMIGSALRHLGWWLEWHTRAAPSEASRPIAESGVPSTSQPVAAGADRVV